MAVELFDVVEPRPEVLAGALTDAVFAASLDGVVAGTAPDAYGDPGAFFAATYPRPACVVCSTRCWTASVAVVPTAPRWCAWRPRLAAIMGGRPTLVLIEIARYSPWPAAERWGDGNPRELEVRALMSTPTPKGGDQPDLVRARCRGSCPAARGRA